MAKQQLSDIRGVAKAERERDRRAEQEERLAKRRQAREQRSEPETRAGKAPSAPVSSR